MNTLTRRALAIGIVLLAALVLMVGSALIAWGFFFPSWRFGPMRDRFQLFARDYSSNGEQIYLTGASRTGPRITARMQGMHEMAPPRLACASCHGENAQGGTVQMMMGTFEAPDIRYKSLSGEEHGEANDEHSPYTEKTLKQAITQGVDPSGEALDWVMPRWEMTDQQLDDLIAYLKELE